jgi:hypothetical protein
MPTPQQQSPAMARPATALSPWTGLILGLVAGAATFGISRAVHPIYRVGKEFDVPSIGAPTELFLANRREQDKVNRKHAMIYVGGLALLIAVALAAVIAAPRHSWLAPLAAAPLGALGGAGGAYLGSLAEVYVRTNIGQAELNHTIGMQLAVGLPLGLGIGLGVGLATRSLAGTLKTALAGLASGALAAALYPVLVSVLLPAAETETVLPVETNSRVMWFAVYSGLLGVIIPVAGRVRGGRKPPS